MRPVWSPILSLGPTARLLAAFCVLGAVLSTVFPYGAAAQQSLQELLEQARERGQQAAPLPSPLDQAREAEALEAETQREERRQGREARSDVAEARMRALLLDRFCSGAFAAEAGARIAATHGLSRIEVDYCRRASQYLPQYGYGLFEEGAAPDVPLNGALPADYVLGIGDELIITFRGQQSRSLSATVDREGRVILPDMDPIRAAGRRLQEFRQDLEDQTARVFIGTSVFVSVGRLRQISVLVAGEVERPGVLRLTALSTVLDALRAARIKKSGSLRRVRLERGDRVEWVDIYELLDSGILSASLNLLDGDRIVVPVIGPTVAVAGRVLRPGIFELAEGETAIGTGEALGLAGGTVRGTGHRFLRLRLDEEGRETTQPAAPEGDRLARGDILTARDEAREQQDVVALAGHVTMPGPRPLMTVETVADLLQGGDLLRRDAYLPYAVLETTDPGTLARQYFGISLEDVLQGKANYRLKGQDRLVVLGLDDIRFLSSSNVQDILAGRSALVRAAGATGAARAEAASLAAGLTARAPAPDLGGDGIAAALRATEGGGGCAGLLRLAQIIADGGERRFAAATRLYGTVPAQAACPAIFQGNGELLPFLLEQAATVYGEVRRPGVYPVTETTSLSSLVSIMGGLTERADTAHVEVLRGEPREAGPAMPEILALGEAEARARIGPGDLVQFASLPLARQAGAVEVRGAVLRPGRYGIRPGERLSELLDRAGGLTPQAYPYGAVFTRNAIREVQREAFARTARELESGLLTLLSRPDTPVEAVASLQTVAQRLRDTEPVGRMVVEADPTVLRARPDLDTPLTAGDAIFIPKRPTYVSVAGDVLNPGALQFVSGENASYYLDRSGGLLASADGGRLFVIFPDGSAERVSTSLWNPSRTPIPPGSTVVAPRDPRPFDALGFTREIAQITSQLFLTAAAVATINNN